MAKDEPKEAVSGRTQIHRLYEGAGKDHDADFGGVTREQRIAKYHRDMAPTVNADLTHARSVVVAKMQAAPGAGRPDTKFDRWYDPDEWGAKGEYIGAQPCVKPPRPDEGVLELEAVKRAAKASEKMKSSLQSVPNTFPEPTGPVPMRPAKRGRPPRA